MFVFVFISPRYLRQLFIDEQSMNKVDKDNRYNTKDDIDGVNIMLGEFFKRNLHTHLLRIANSTEVDEFVNSVRHPQRATNNGNLTSSKEINTKNGVNESTVAKARKRRIPAPEKYTDFDLNCDAEAASKEFLAAVQTSDSRTQEAFKNCEPNYPRLPKTLLHYIARLVWLDVINNPVLADEMGHALIAQREDFDLKANALSKWAD